MKKWILTLSGLALAGVAGLALLFLYFDNRLPLPFQPNLDAKTGLEALSAGDLQEGHGYLLSRHSWLRVDQNYKGGLLVSWVNDAWGFSKNATLFLETDRHLADGSPLPARVCTVYSGLYQYPTTDGGNSTVHAFREIPCEGYDTAWLGGEK